MPIQLFRFFPAPFVALYLLGFSVAAGQSPDWRAGEKIDLAVDVGPLGATRPSHCSVPPMCLGNGPRDLLVSDGRLLPFQRFTADGVPVYGQPKAFDAPDGSLARERIKVGLSMIPSLLPLPAPANEFLKDSKSNSKH